MSEPLERAWAKVQDLSPDEQDAIAAIILEELEDERRWEQAFARSQEKLARMADRVREDIRADRFRKMGVDEL